jgi:flagellar assembly factor FliW
MTQMHTCCDDTLPFTPVSTGTLMTRLGTILFTPDDIYTFNTGLTGFREYNTFVRTFVPNIPSHLTYGMLQSLENMDLSFILFYPALDEMQRERIVTQVRILAADEALSNDDIEIAFLVIVNKDDASKPTTTLVKDAPLVFMKKTQMAWQIVLL